uniref:Neurotransmitter-gated ion-channel ligand-binding domain-containing protein n=1 Tax=Panagrolaimus sp. JU765 TaxID=591449 RepID=A0AC34PYT4_9BILA
APIKSIQKGAEYVPDEAPPRYVKLLYASLFKDYHNELRPVLNDTEPLKVAMQFWLKQILKIKEKDQTVLVYCWLELYWKDEFLTWNPAEFGGVEKIHVPASRLWKPDILVYNNANMNVKDNELDTFAIVNHRGDVILFRSMITDVTCEFSYRLKDFPFDQQVCYLTFASWSYDGSKIRLVPVNGTDNLELYIPNTEWKLTDFAVKVYEKMYDCCPNAPFIDITYFFALKRSPS